MKRSIVTLFVFFVLLLSVIGKPPVKFGKIDIEDLKMEVYDLDTSAPAIVLCDYGRFNSTTFDFVRILRIKILKKEGFSWGNKLFPGSQKTAIRGKTYNLVNGEIITDKLKSESIYRERITDDYYRMRIAMPNVKVGSVIDIEFTFPGIPFIWYFQQVIPVKWSELIIESSPYIDFRKNFYGFENLDVNTDTRWIAKNMPAFKKEPYTNSIENYITKFEFDILSISFPGYYKSFTTSWDAVANLLDKSDYFGKAIDGNIFLNRIAKEIESSCTSDIDKLKSACDSIKKVKWNEDERLLTSNNLYLIYNKEIGNSADINLMLVSLLNKLDIPAFPVAMSTRKNGLLPYYPTLEKLNYVIACAKLHDETYFLDATEELMPYDFLPERCLNYRGILIQNDKGSQIEIKSPGERKEAAAYMLNLNDDLTLSGNAEYIRHEYCAFDFRKDYQQFNSEDDFLENIENENPGLRIHDFTIENLDSISLPVKEKYEIEVVNSVTAINNMLYFNPLLFDSMKENPFKVDQRKYPVDYALCEDKTYLYNFIIPDGYEIVELPESVIIKLPGKAIQATFNVTHLDNKITVFYRFNINKEIFVSTEYQVLKEFYNQLIKKHAEFIILKKI